MTEAMNLPPLPDQAVGMIWAQTRDGVIGRAGDMPWNAPEDMAHFKATTMAHPVVMGRRTWQSIPDRFRPFAGRTNVVLTRDPEVTAEAEAAGALVFTDLDEALAAATDAPGGELVWIVGGGSLYAAAADRADVAVITVLDLEVTDGDTFAPALPPGFINVASVPAEGFTPSDRGPAYRFETWVAGDDL